MIRAQSHFINALRWGTYLAAARLTIFQGGQATPIVFPVSDANFTVDRSSEFRRQGSITVEILPSVPPQTAVIAGNMQTLLPLTPTGIFAPFGNEVLVELTIMGPGDNVGANGWVPMGIYQIVTSTVNDAGINLTTTLKVYDRSWAVAQRQLLQSYTVPNTTSIYGAGTDLQTQIEALVYTAWGGQPPWTYKITPSTYVVPSGTYNQGQDPWQACLDLASAAGYELFFDINGNVVGQPLADSSGNPIFKSNPVVWNFVPNEVSATGTFQHPLGGTPYTTPVGIQVDMTRDGVSNDFYVSSTGGPFNSGTLTQANAADTSATSPTQIHGQMGDIPQFIYDSNITSLTQAQGEANYLLAQSLLKAWTLTVATSLNPLFDINDVVTATQPRLNLNAQKFVIDTISTSVRYDVTTVVSGRVISS